MMNVESSLTSLNFMKDHIAKETLAAFAAGSQSFPFTVARSQSVRFIYNLNFSYKNIENVICEYLVTLHMKYTEGK